ncbi:MAG: leucine--tRNA ligase [Betaproteobacteria bacterium]|nr:leucine--tRNA ligase [Betaproteobacteria bacterium]
MDARDAAANPYHPQAIEPAFQTEWEAANAYRATEDTRKPKFYCVSMLPYPSGKLHMGHVRNYTISDVMSRQLRMKGFNVLHPMGWDAFGLPAENAAMKNGVPPAQWTYENIAYMKKQCKAMGWGLDWSREVATCDPAYYKWNQWLFLKMLEKGIAYRKTGVVNWDPVDMTVLANEQVVDGKGWRSGAPVEKREIPMYYLRITDYADELLAQLDKMDGWPAEVRLMQKNWIGKSVGAEIHFPYDEESIGKAGVLKVFSTRPDTLYGATFMAVAAEHPLALQAAQHNAGLAAFIEECKKGGVTEAELATQEKKGMPTGLFCLHPLTQKKLPIWVGNYVLMGYGEGAVMGVPAHDERDFAFAKKYELRIVQVVDVPGKDWSIEKWQDWYSDDGVAIASEDFTGLTTAQFKEKIGAVLSAIDLGGPRTTYRLRDWGISRQRYWGTPVPIIHCGDCGPVPVPYEDLPVVLPEDCVPDGSGNPLNKREDFLKCACPKCGKPARRETDTMDTFVDSSWYFMRYASAGAETMVDARNDHWNPMDQYIGGISHAILHLLYARFWTKVMRDMNMLKYDEPFTKLLTQGMVLNHIYLRRNDKGGIDYHAPDSVIAKHDEHGKVTGYVSKADGLPVEYNGIGTMSKSKLNGVDPQDIIDKYGADSARLFVMFAAPPELTIEWSDAGVEGANRFLNRVWRFVFGVSDVAATTGWKTADANIRSARMELHKTLAQATFDYGRAQYNTVVSACMKMLNTLEKVPADSPAGNALRAEGTSILLRTLYPVTPHITSALWRNVGYEKLHGSLLDAPWPEVAADALQQDEIELVLQINGKTRGKVTVPAKATREEVEELVRMDETALKYAEGGIKKVIVVPGRLVNVVI